MVIHIHPPLSQRPSAQLPSPSPSGRTSASSRPLSSAAPAGTRDAWPHTSAANWNRQVQVQSIKGAQPVTEQVLRTLTSRAGVRVSGSPDWFALWSRVFESHFLQFTTSVQLIVASVSLLSQVLHVYTDQHLPQFHKVTVVFIFH